MNERTHHAARPDGDATDSQGTSDQLPGAASPSAPAKSQEFDLESAQHDLDRAFGPAARDAACASLDFFQKIIKVPCECGPFYYAVPRDTKIGVVRARKIDKTCLDVTPQVLFDHNGMEQPCWPCQARRLLR